MNKLKCIYCDNTVKNQNEFHFQSDCCGRGMCQKCYDKLVGTDEQIQMDFFELNKEDEKTKKIIKINGWENATYICFDCFNK